MLVKRSTISPDNPSVTFRVQTGPPVTYYFARWQESAQAYQLLKLVNSTATVLGTFASTFAVGASHTLRLSCVGSTISVSLDGTQVISVTDTSITAAGQAGVRWTNGQSPTTGIHFDSFVAVSQ